MNLLNTTYFREHGGKALREAREAKGLTGVEVAASAGISGGFLSEIETGKRRGKHDTLAKVCEALGTTLEDVELRAEALAGLHRNESAKSIYRRDDEEESGRVVREDSKPYLVRRDKTVNAPADYEELARWLLDTQVGVKRALQELAPSLFRKAQEGDAKSNRLVRQMLELLESNDDE